MTPLSFKDVMTMDRAELKTFKKSADFHVDPDSMGKDARLSIYARPIPGNLYVAGGDFAYGIEGRDYDTLVISNKNTDPVEQVAELEGRWGAERFDRLCYCMCRFFNSAFLVGERQVGLPVLRSLVNNFDYGYLYYERNEATKTRRRLDVLGHHKSAGDPTMPQFVRAVHDKQFIPRSERLWQQLKAYQWRPRGKDKEKTEEMRDSDLSMGAPAGEFDDLVNGGAYMWKGVLEVHRFDDQKPVFPEGTAGDVLGMSDALRMRPKEKPRTAFRGYGK